jgi:hypothetical protein
LTLKNTLTISYYFYILAINIIDNNMVENAIRPFMAGRKNWLFSGTFEGVEASAPSVL